MPSSDGFSLILEPNAKTDYDEGDAEAENQQ